jgi:hypothetical protein
MNALPTRLLLLSGRSCFCQSMIAGRCSIEWQHLDRVSRGMFNAADPTRFCIFWEIGKVLVYCPTKCGPLECVLHLITRKGWFLLYVITINDKLESHIIVMSILSIGVTW